jgi:hypothetical protein
MSRGSEHWPYFDEYACTVSVGEVVQNHCVQKLVLGGCANCVVGALAAELARYESADCATADRIAEEAEAQAVPEGVERECCGSCRKWVREPIPDVEGFCAEHRTETTDSGYCGGWERPKAIAAAQAGEADTKEEDPDAA